MESLYNVETNFEGMDEDFYKELAKENPQYMWSVDETSARFNVVLTIDDIADFFTEMETELEAGERAEILAITSGESCEISRGHGNWYEITKK